MTRLQSLSDRWPEISALLDEGLELAAEERAQWLESLSGERARLRDTVRELLASHARAETADFMGTLPKSSGTPHWPVGADELVPGDTLGPYRVISPLGRGGMGVVWLAERADGQLRRKVALKLPHMVWGSAVAERLARERDILASLTHPHIARLYDAGVDQQLRPYLAMEYVEGQSIDAYCRERSLPVSDRLVLLLQVASAVAHAHARLVVHRDLKPANILVTSEGQVRLLDFGIAKLMEGDRTEETALTLRAGHALTLDYASPEQIRGEPLGTASDVYSLGVVAFELLAGSRPYTRLRGSAAELEEAIKSTDARLASEVASGAALRRQLRGDLDSILNKALKKRAAERYATVDAFAEDLRRHLNQQPVLAQADRLSYRFAKFVRRYRLQVAVASMAAVALLSGTGVALWQAREARLQAARAEEVKDLIVSIFKDSQTGRGGSRKTTAAELLTQAQRRLADAPVGDPAVRAELLTSIGAGLTGLSEYAAAQQLLEQVVRDASARLGAQHPRTISAELALAAAMVDWDAYERAEPILDAVEERLRRLPPGSDLVEALRLKAVLYVRLGRFEQGDAAAQAAIHTAESMPESKSLRERMVAQHTLAQARTDARRPGYLEPARKAYELALQRDGGRMTADVLTERSLFALALTHEGEAARALSELRALLPPMIELLGPQHQQVQRTYGRIGFAAEALGDGLTAVEGWRQAKAIELAWSNGQPTGRSAFYGFGVARGFAAARRFDEAELETRRAIEDLKAAPAPGQHNVLMTDAALGWALTDSGKLTEADTVLARLFVKPFERPEQAATAKFALGRLRSAQGRHEDALRLIDEAAPMYFASQQHHVRTMARVVIGNAQLEAGRFDEALTSLERARQLLEASQPEMSAERADLMISLARARLRRGEPSLAGPLAADALGFWRHFDASHRQTAIAALCFAQAQMASGANGSAHALKEADASVRVAGGPAERAWLARLKQEFGAPTVRIRTGPRLRFAPAPGVVVTL